MVSVMGCTKSWLQSVSSIFLRIIFIDSGSQDTFPLQHEILSKKQGRKRGNGILRDLVKMI